MKRVVIFGIGAHARRLFVYLTTDSKHDVVAFTVDRKHLDEPHLLGLPVVPFEELDQTHPPESHALCVTVGYRDVNQARARTCGRCLDRGYQLISYTSSLAHCWSNRIGSRNTLIFNRTTVDPFAAVGDDVVLINCHVSHDAVVADHCFIVSGVVIGGGARIDEYCFIGLNATIRDGVTVAARCVIGAGAVIMRDTEEGDVYSVRATEALPIKSWELHDL
jgi:sugar O-acyltransferase (sialic acid O-acetyltransferase NeuD family)